MRISFNRKAQSAFRKLGAVALITADTTVSMSFEPNPVEGGAVLILSPDHLNIKVAANTEDGSDITVEGCTETRLASDTKTTLHARGTTVILKGKITELDVSGTYANKQTLTALNVQGLNALQKLDCYRNKLTELNVQGCTSLQKLLCENNDTITALNVQGCTSLKILLCDQNKLNADAFTKLFNDLPKWEESDGAEAILYSKETGVAEGNCTDFTQPASLKAAFDNAKDAKHWAMKKLNGVGFDEDI